MLFFTCLKRTSPAAQRQEPSAEESERMLLWVGSLMSLPEGKRTDCKRIWLICGCAGVLAEGALFKIGAKENQKEIPPKFRVPRFSLKPLRGSYVARRAGSLHTPHHIPTLHTLHQQNRLAGCMPLDEYPD